MSGRLLNSGSLGPVVDRRRYLRKPSVHMRLTSAPFAVEAYRKCRLPEVEAVLGARAAAIEISRIPKAKSKCSTRPVLQYFASRKRWTRAQGFGNGF
ncbi:hypothetical protein NDU88_007449 [Pleurodeles waltl]|uniref:Uncharacterized protein n=1 Tax=Pleurodeles waltl TaxID=8319 RepID=A0AAV7U163_PLEWA|nr:hypothetical protein NDU88_007449 [Pleurodeles waltl]